MNLFLTCADINYSFRMQFENSPCGQMKPHPGHMTPSTQLTWFLAANQLAAAIFLQLCQLVFVPDEKVKHIKKKLC